MTCLLVVAACGDDSAESDTAQSDPADSAVCGYHYEWISSFRFPLQPDPHAAYSYVVPIVSDDPVGFEITGPLPYSAWTSWTVYTDLQGGVQPYSVVEAAAITPDGGSVNPFVPGTRVLAADRDFRLLAVPDGTDMTTIDESLQDIPSSNILSTPSDGDFFIFANRVYNAFPGYNQGGAAGPTDGAFPEVKAVNLETGDDLDCTDLNLLPSPQPPTEMPTERAPAAGTLSLGNGQQLPIGPQASSDGEGLEFAPELDPDLIEFTRPPLLPGADVPSVPPPDSCAGYLGAATSTTEIGLIRMPHVATWFDTSDLTAQSLFEQEEAAYISLTQYGDAIGSYESGEPDTASLGNEELLVDPSGGSTIVVWPRSPTSSEQDEVFAHADEQDWAILRGDEQGRVTTSNVLSG